MKTQIVIVGDDSHLGLALQTVLLDQGYSVLQHRTGEEEETDAMAALVIRILPTAVEVRSQAGMESIRLHRPVDTTRLLALAERSINPSVSQNSPIRKTLEPHFSRARGRIHSTSGDVSQQNQPASNATRNSTVL